MRVELVYCGYSSDRQYRFEIYRKQNLYEIWIQRRITDEFMGDDWFDYHDIADAANITDSAERAIELGRECMRCFYYNDFIYGDEAVCATRIILLPIQK